MNRRRYISVLLATLVTALAISVILWADRSRSLTEHQRLLTQLCAVAVEFGFTLFVLVDVMRSRRQEFRTLVVALFALQRQLIGARKRRQRKVHAELLRRAREKPPKLSPPDRRAFAP